MARITKKIVKEYMDFIGHGPMVWREMVEFIEAHAPEYGNSTIEFARDIALELRSLVNLRGVEKEPLAPQALYLTICMLTNGFSADRRIVDHIGSVFRSVIEREKVYADDVLVHDPKTGDSVMTVQKAAETWLEQPVA